MRAFERILPLDYILLMETVRHWRLRSQRYNLLGDKRTINGIDEFKLAGSGPESEIWKNEARSNGHHLENNPQQQIIYQAPPIHGENGRIKKTIHIETELPVPTTLTNY